MIAPQPSCAARVLLTDLRLHGRRFIVVEFIGAAVLSVGVAVAVGAAAFIRGSAFVSAGIAVVFFIGVAINSVGVVSWVRQHPIEEFDGRASARDLALFALSTLVPGALVLALRRASKTPQPPRRFDERSD